MNPREVSGTVSSKKTKSFREKLFGTKSRSKSKETEEECKFKATIQILFYTHIFFHKIKSHLIFLHLIYYVTEYSFHIFQ